MEINRGGDCLARYENYVSSISHVRMIAGLVLVVNRRSRKR
jgi:hypothetical protein